MRAKASILLAEDDRFLRELMKEALEEKGYQVIVCGDGDSAIDAFDKDRFDVTLLDVMMPGKDGFAVARKIRQQSDMHPILFISTRMMTDDRLKGYATGADDYITKPFNMNELTCKIEVFLRRSKRMFADTSGNYNIGQCLFSYSQLTLHTPAGIYSLRPKEADLLKFLCTFPNRILKREEILLAVWAKDDFFLGRSMDVYMTKLRKYLRGDPDVAIETIHGVGFRFRIP